GLLQQSEGARRGLRGGMVEAGPSQSTHSKALAIMPRTMEIFDMAGVVGPFLQHANRVTTVAIVPQQRTLARIPFRPADSPYRFVAMVPQDMTERLLVEELRRKGGAVEYDTACLSVEEQSDGGVG